MLRRHIQDGYTSKGQITTVVNGKTVKVPVAQIKIVPPQGGTAAISPKNQTSGKTK